MKILRHIDTRKYNLDLLSKFYFSNSEYECSYSTLKECDNLVNFVSPDKSWSVWFSITQLGYSIFPELSGVFINSDIAQSIVQLISINKNTIVNGLDIIPILSMTHSGVISVESLTDDFMLKVSSSNFFVYIEKCPLLNINFEFNFEVYDRLKFPVYVKCGEIICDLHLFKMISVGDVLIIKHPALSLYTYSKQIYISKWNKGFDMVENFDLLPSTTDDDCEIKCDEINIKENDSIDNLPVKIDVVIFSTLITLKELYEIQSRKIFNLPQGVHKNISLKVNGQLIANGELVEFDNNLAVEINNVVYGEAK